MCSEKIFLHQFIGSEFKTSGPGSKSKIWRKNYLNSTDEVFYFILILKFVVVKRDGSVSKKGVFKIVFLNIGSWKARFGCASAWKAEFGSAWKNGADPQQCIRQCTLAAYLQYRNIITYSIVILLWRKFIGDKSASGMLIIRQSSLHLRAKGE